MSSPQIPQILTEKKKKSSPQISQILTEKRILIGVNLRYLWWKKYLCYLVLSEKKSSLQILTEKIKLICVNLRYLWWKIKI